MSAGFRLLLHTSRRVIVALCLLLAAGVLVAPASRAAGALRLSGTFSVHETVAEATNIYGDKAGDEFDVSWSFTPQCTAAPCDTTIVRHLTNGTTRTYLLKLQADGSYSGTLAYTDNCYSSNGSVIAANGYDSTEALTLVPGSSTSSDATSFAGTLTDDGTANSAGQAANCPSSTHEKITFAGTAAGPQFTTAPSGVVTPDQGQGFQIAATDRGGQEVSLSWTTPPTTPTAVDCGSQPTAPALTAIVFCRLTGVSSVGATASMVFTATDTSGLTAQVTVVIGPQAQPVKVTIDSPQFEVVRYIHTFSPTACANSVYQSSGLFGKTLAGELRGLVACTAINATHNPVPASDIASSPANWNAFVGTKEYRTLLTLPSLELSCVNGKAAGLTQTGGSYGRNFGYTPVGVGRALTFIGGQPYYGDSDRWYSTAPEVTLSPAGDTYTISYRAAVAASDVESFAGVLPTGYTLPFVWVATTRILSCSGDRGIEFDLSDTPSTMIYRSGQLIYSTLQTSDWGHFLASGGRNFSPGYGNLDPYCSTVSFVPSSINAVEESGCSGPPPL